MCERKPSYEKNVLCARHRLRDKRVFVCRFVCVCVHVCVRVLRHCMCLCSVCSVHNTNITATTKETYAVKAWRSRRHTAIDPLKKKNKTMGKIASESHNFHRIFRIWAIIHKNSELSIQNPAIERGLAKCSCIIQIVVCLTFIPSCVCTIYVCVCETKDDKTTYTLFNVCINVIVQHTQ